MLTKLIDLQVLGDERGSLIAMEEFKNVPFKIKRIYYLFDTKQEVSRGFHAHKKLQQLAICVRGNCRFILDNGKTKEVVLLNTPDKGLFLENNIWHEMHDFSDDCVLMILADDLYDESDYIRCYQSFLSSII
jgi:dTDP-4-dehydrorhamnose 3,5-epimerase-like enzyme